MKKLFFLSKINYFYLLIFFLFPSIFLLNSQVKAQQNRQSLPMKITTSEGYYELTVPDTQTTKSAFGGKLRIYDLHIAKMFEVTYQDCQEFNSDRQWSYFAGNGNINMGTFYISCKLAQDIVTAYGLGSPQTTNIIYGQEESGAPISRQHSIPTLNLVGGKQEKWVNFCKKFKPISF